MRYIPLNNLPNVSESSNSISPSLKIDDRNYPHISYIKTINNINQINYSYFDGLKWAFYDIPKVYVSQEDIIFSPNSLWLNSNSPVIGFARKNGSGSRLSLATYNSEWSFNNLDVLYSVGWIGAVGTKDFSNSSSSSMSESTSSSSSYSGNDFYVVSYDSTNSQIMAYLVNYLGWTLIGSKSVAIEDFNSLKIDLCGKKMGIAFISTSSVIKYNFFDIDSYAWSFANFRDIADSQSYGTIYEMDLKGYVDGPTSIISVAWLAHDNSTSYTNHILCYDNGSEIYLDGISSVIESKEIDVTATNYIVNGYKKISICLNSYKMPEIIAMGLSSKYFCYTIAWTKEIINVEGVANGIVTDYLVAEYGNNAKISLACDSGDIYYFEPSSGNFTATTPHMILLNDKWAYKADFSSGKLNGLDLPDTYGNIAGNVLRDTERPICIVSNTSSPLTTTTTTTP